jgi:signal transduction histidine kinase
MFKSPAIRLVFAIALLLTIAIIDFNIVFEISLAIFYVVPILIFSYQDKYHFNYSLIFAVLTSVLWEYVDNFTHPYSHASYQVVNFITRAILFVLAAYASKGFFEERKLLKIITEQKLQQEKTNQQLEASNTELNKFIGMAAHDIRNPVGAIKMMSEMLLDKNDLDAEMRQWMELVKTSATNSLQILNDTLNISQIQSGTINLNLTEEDVVKFLKESIQLIQYQAEKKHQIIHFETSIFKVMLSFDKSRMTQVVNNLYTNAIKYSPANTEIFVSLSWEQSDHKKLLISVKDQGMGIDQKYHATLFNPFTTTSNQPTDNESKTGLGLAIVKKIVELHHGSIGFTSEIGSGSTFYFTLPVITTKA